MNNNTLFINHLHDVAWKKTSAEIHANLPSTSVWKVKVSSFRTHLDYFKTLLNPPELEKAMRYHQENDRNHRLIGRAVLRILLSRYLNITPQKIQFSADKNQKPTLKNPVSSQFHFNVSHSGDYILIAISANPVGADLEKIDASFTWQNLLSMSFSETEADFIAKSAQPAQSFYRLWTRKECLLKATGKGLVDELSAVPCLDGVYKIPSEILEPAQSWQISSFSVDENHVASLAFYPVKTALQFFNFQL